MTSWHLGPRGQRWFDAALATALLLPALLIPFFDAGWPGFAIALVQLVPLYWRRHHAVSVFAVVAVGSAAQAVLFDIPPWSQMAFPVAVYAVARYASTRLGLAAVGVGVCGAVVAAFRWVLGLGSNDPGAILAYVITITTIVVSAWALGTLARTRQAYVDALVERAERIEHEAAQQVALAASDERARIAREMHDVVAHGLSTIVVQADGARYAARTDPAIATRTLEQISATGREALTEMRRLLGLLRSGEAERRPQPGLADLPGLVVGEEVSATLPDPATTTVPDGVALTTYRIVQEALTNVRRHAGATAKAPERPRRRPSRSRSPTWSRCSSRTTAAAPPPRATVAGWAWATRTLPAAGLATG